MRLCKSVLIVTLLVIAGATAAQVARNDHLHRIEPSPSRLIVAPAETIVCKATMPSVDDARNITLLLRNEGGSPLQITSVVTSCGCTVVETLSNGRVCPGEEARLRVRASVPDVGEKITYVDVFADSTLTPVVRATVVLKGSEPEVPYLTQLRDAILLAAAPGDLDTKEFSIAALEREDAAPWLCGVHCDDDHFQATLSDPRPAVGALAGTVVRQYTVRVVFRAPTSGRRYGHMRIAARDRMEHVATVQISGEARSPLRAVPDSIVVSADQLPITKIIGFLIDGEGDDLVVKAAPSANPLIEVGAVEYLAKQSLVAARVEIRIARVPEGVGDYVSTINATCGEPSSRSLSIPLVVKR